MELLILFDEKDICVCDLRNQQDLDEDVSNELELDKNSVHRHEGIGVLGLMLIENWHLYVMSEGMAEEFQPDTSDMSLAEKSKIMNSSNQDGHGLGYINLELLLAKPDNKPKIVEIMPALCGYDCEIEYDPNSSKLVLEQGFNRIAILPLLHRPVLPLEGINEKSNYLFAQQHKDKLIAIGKLKNYVQAWDLQNGKRLNLKVEGGVNFKISEKMKLDPNEFDQVAVNLDR